MSGTRNYLMGSSSHFKFYRCLGVINVVKGIDGVHATFKSVNVLFGHNAACMRAQVIQGNIVAHVVME